MSKFNVGILRNFGFRIGVGATSSSRHDEEGGRQSVLRRVGSLYILSSRGYWGTTTLSGSRSWSQNSRSCCSRASNGRDLASTCVLRPRLEDLVSLNFRGTELRSRRRIGLRSEL